MPHIIAMFYFWILFTDKLIFLFMSVDNQHLHLKRITGQEFQSPSKSLLFHVVARLYFVALQLEITNIVTSHYVN